MTAEEYLNKYCQPEDWNNLEECLKDSILTNNVIEHMERYAALRKNEVVGQSEQLIDLIEKQNGNFANTVSADGFIDRIIDIPFKQYTGCYLLYSENELVYVGVACDVAVRLWQHRYKKGKHWDKVKYIEETDYLKAIQIENYFINTYKPKYNKAGSKLEWSKLSFKDKFDESKIPYPSGWNYPLTPKQQQHEQN